MIEAYKIGVSLVLDQTRLIGPLTEALKAFEKIQSAAKNTQIGINEMVTSLRGAARVAASFADEMERAARASGRMQVGAGGATGGGPRVVYGGPRTTSTGLMVTGNNVPGGYTPGGAMTPLSPNFIPRYPALNINQPIPPFPGGDAYMAGYGAMMVGHGAGGFLESVFGAGFDANSIVAQMRASRFTEAQIAASRAQARGLVGSVPGFGYGEGLDLILQTASFTGDADEALGMTPRLARNAQVLAQFGKRDAIQQVESAIKAGELTGLTDKNGNINISKMMDFVDRLTAVVVSGGGTLDINQYLTGLRQYGTGSVAASTDFLTAVLPAYMKILGGSKAGTALSSLQQSMFAPISPTNGKRYRAEQEKIGIRDAAGNVVDPDGLRSDVFNWTIQTLLPKLVAKGFDTPGKIQSELLNLFPRQTIARLMDAGIFDAGVIEKEANRNRAQIAAGSAPLDKLLAESPQNQVAAFHASLNLLLTSLADPNMGAATKSLQDISGALKFMADEVEKHPNVARWIIDVATGLAVLGTVVGGLLVTLAPMLALYKVGKWGVVAGGAAGANSIMRQRTAAGLLGLGGILGVPALGGAVVHSIDDNDAIGSWVDNHIPGAASVDDWFYRMTGGYVGRQSAAPSSATGRGPDQFGAMPVYVINPADIARGATSYITGRLNAPPTGPTQPDGRIGPQMPGDVGNYPVQGP